MNYKSQDFANKAKTINDLTELLDSTDLEDGGPEAVDQMWELEITEWTFSDGSTLTMNGSDTYTQDFNSVNCQHVEYA